MTTTLVREPDRQAFLDEHGWTRLPQLDRETLDRLRDLHADVKERLESHERCAELGFAELWVDPDLSFRDEVSRRMHAILRPAYERWFLPHRAVVFNIITKKPHAPDSRVPFHRDFAVLDERQGESALHVWIPLIDLGPASGGIVLVEGSHRKAPPVRSFDLVNPFPALEKGQMPPGAVQPELAAGEGVAFWNSTAHGSPPNLAGLTRTALGGIIVPAAAQLVHWIRRAPDRAELWALDDDGFRALMPGEKFVPPNSRLADVVTGEALRALGE